MADETTPAIPAAPEAAAAPAAAAPAAAPAPAADKQPTGGDRQVSQSIWAEIGGEGAESTKIVKAKGSKNVTSGIVIVRSSFNNTMVTTAPAPAVSPLSVPSRPSVSKSPPSRTSLPSRTMAAVRRRPAASNLFQHSFFLTHGSLHWSS
jgi:hypothetical protein